VQFSIIFKSSVDALLNVNALHGKWPMVKVKTRMWPMPYLMAALPNIGGALC